MRNRILALATSAALLAAGAANADVETASFTVSATVVKSCLVDATDLNFGVYTGVADVDVNSEVRVRCTSGTAYTVALDDGLHGTFVNREMENAAGNPLVYNLYTDANRTFVFGDDTGATDNVVGAGTGLSDAAERTIQVYGRLFDSDPNKNAPPGDYSDTIQVTVTY